MAKQRRKPGVGFYGMVAVVTILILYPVLFGPACWITSHAGYRINILSTAYRPLLRLMSREELFEIDHQERPDRSIGITSSRPLTTGVLVWWVTCWARNGAHWQYTVNYEYNRGTPIKVENEEWQWCWPGR